MTVRVLEGDCRAVLAGLPAGSVQCCVTSPPYFGLRDYGTARWDGGHPECDHLSGMVPVSPDDPGIRRSTLKGGKRTTTAQAEVRMFRGECKKCGATRVDSQIGLEPTPDEYVARMVEVFREVRRVLRDDGVTFLNLGDSYLPNKQLAGIPWRVAFALQADGWWLRSEIIWHKPNPMPESVTDRPTKSHEQIFLLTKSPTYFYDAGAIAERSESEGRVPLGGKKTASERNDGDRSVRPLCVSPVPATRNARSVWTVATASYSGAHFATMPPELVRRCVAAGSRRGDTVLDPFGGAGTTGLVADRLGRDAVLIELNPEYAAMARNRIHSDAPLFTDVA